MNKKTFMVIASIALAALLLVIFMARSNSGNVVTNEENILETSEGEIIVNGERLSLEPQKDLEVTPNKIPISGPFNPSQISGVITEGASRKLVLIDGSKVELTPSVFAELPVEVQTRLSYEIEE
jgi:hypothetical protein